MNSPTHKPIWKSKTVLVQVLSLVAMFIPQVAAWVAANPVEFVAVLGAINTLVRFATSGKVTIFPEDDDTSGSSSSAGMGVPGGKAGSERESAADAVANERHRSGFPWLVGPACVVALLSGCVVGVDEEGNYSLRPDPHTIDVGLKYLIRHEEESAKSGLTTWEYYDAETGALIDPKDYPAYGIKP